MPPIASLISSHLILLLVLGMNEKILLACHQELKCKQRESYSKRLIYVLCAYFVLSNDPFLFVSLPIKRNNRSRVNET